ncbi:YgiT-type zinc finger protein [Candidatus Desantisbacteria bacterium]|nr:YgiT-type zinc finger protein [Candidatus Desantisbacteria bacterium]
MRYLCHKFSRNPNGSTTELGGKENEMRILGGNTENKLVTFTYEEDNKILFVEHVPAEVCTKCGENL